MLPSVTRIIKYGLYFSKACHYGKNQQAMSSSVIRPLTNPGQIK